MNDNQKPSWIPGTCIDCAVAVTDRIMCPICFHKRETRMDDIIEAIEKKYPYKSHTI